MAASGYVPPRDLSSTTYSNPSPNSYQKFPWWEMLLWEGVAALWLTISLKRFFFFKQIFSRRIQRFSKATAKTEQLIILFLKGLPLHRQSLYLKILEMLRFTILLCCTWPLGKEVGNRRIKYSQQGWACSARVNQPSLEVWDLPQFPRAAGCNGRTTAATSDQDGGNLIIYGVHGVCGDACYRSEWCHNRVSLKSCLR